MLGAVAGELKPVYLLTGGDRPKIARALDRLRSRFDENAVELLAAPETSADEVAAACNALGLFGGDTGGRLVVVDDVDGRRSNEGRLVHGWKAQDVKTITAYLTAPAPGTVLALVAHELKANSPLGKACAKAGEVLVYDVVKRKIPEWVAEQLERLGASFEPEVPRALVDLVGEDIEELATEVDKLATWAAGGTIAVGDVEQLAAGRAETSIFALTDAWGRRDTAAVLSAAESLLERSGRPRSSELPRLVGLLVGHVGRVRACRTLAAEGLTARDAASRLKMHPFAAEKAFVQARNFSSDELGDTIVRLAQLDHAVKGGSRLSPDLELERALVAVTRRRGSNAG
jgi:DNA polymerase III delta subunit